MKTIAMCMTIAALALLISAGASAQSTMSVGAGVDLMLPVGSFGDSWGTGFGGTAEFDYVLNAKFSVTGKIGYLTWSSKNLPTGWSATYSGVPLLAGIKWYPSFIPKGAVSIYGHFEMGIMFGSLSTSGPAGRTYPFAAAGSDFTIVPSAGVEIPAGAEGDIDISVRYFDISRKGSIGFRAGYKMGI